jgi:hypothetical protein
MPMTATQLAALVDRARQKPLPVVSPPQPARTARPVPPQKTVPASSTGPSPPLSVTPPAVAAAVPTPPAPALQPERGDEAASEDFPIGWALTKESWHFHRRFFRIFRRPMHRGEYSHLLWQIRHHKAEHLWEDCWRVTLPDGRRTLAVRATRWQLLTILPRAWQPPVAVEPAASAP